VAFQVTNRRAVRAMRNGVEIALALRKLYPRQFDATKLLPLLGNAATISRIEEGKSAQEIAAGWEGDLKTFQQTRAKYLLYR
jgi:uncharacterized protein YbbC (DUF1343 family)